MNQTGLVVSVMIRSCLRVRERGTALPDGTGGAPPGGVVCLPTLKRVRLPRL